MEQPQEICQCDVHTKAIAEFQPYHFNTLTQYRKNMYRLDGTPCGCDEFSYNHLYKKLFRLGDKSVYDAGTSVKLPPYQIEWRMRPADHKDNRQMWPKALPYDSVSRGVLKPDRKADKILKHERNLRYYRSPKPEHLNVVYI